MDTAFIFDALIGSEPINPAESRRPRIGLLSEFVDRADPSIATHVRGAVDRVTEAGATVEEVQLPVEIDLLLAVHRIIMQSEVAAIHAEQLSRHRDDYGPILATEVDVAQLIPAVFEVKARRLRRKIRREIDALLIGYDAWLLPTASILPPPRSAGSTGDPSFQAPWTMLGTPSISLPVGLDDSGLPIGIQLVGRRGEDRSLLSIAAWTESVLGRIDPPDIVAGK